MEINRDFLTISPEEPDFTDDRGCNMHLMDLDEFVEYVQPEQVDDDVCVKEP
jgi:hypothetical protein